MVTVVVVFAGAHVVGLTLSQLPLLVQVNLVLLLLCSICTSGSKLLQCIFFAEHSPMIMFVHVNVTSQSLLGIPAAAGVCLKCTLARLQYTHKDYTYCDR